MIQPDAFCERPRPVPAPLRALLLAMIDRAWEDVLKGSPEQRRDALEWVLAGDVVAASWQGFTFVQVVEALDVDAVAMRVRFEAQARRSRSGAIAGAGRAGRDGDAGAGTAGTTERATLLSVA